MIKKQEKFDFIKKYVFLKIDVANIIANIFNQWSPHETTYFTFICY